MNPVLETEGRLIRLRPIKAGDFESLYAVAADPGLWEQHPASDRYREHVFRAFFDEALAGGMALVAEDKSSGRVIGSSRYSLDSASDGEIEIGWTFLSRDYWGGEYNRELKRLMLRRAFETYSCVIFFVGVGNLRSQRALEKIGAARRDGVIARGGSDHFVYEIGPRACRHL